ncbi:MAG: AMIN domain-containing protein [Desulfovibrionaceae bacterium]|nr:AMIN domain-containing protein [Desulfovibrionaceae bacterium]
MSRTFGQWFRFLAACAASVFLVSAVFVSMGAADGEARNEVRMSVDFTVLPVVLPDGSEAMPPADPDAIDGEATLPSEGTGPGQAAVKPDTEPTPVPIPESAPALDPAPKPEPGPISDPAPKPAAESASAPAPVAGPGIIKSVGLAESRDGFTITLKADRRVGDTSYLNLDNPRRLVIDLRTPWKLDAKNVVRSKGAVKHIVIGEHPDRLRLVVHFSAPPKGRLEPVFTRTGTTLKIAVALP